MSPPQRGSIKSVRSENLRRLPPSGGSFLPRLGDALQKTVVRVNKAAVSRQTLFFTREVLDMRRASIITMLALTALSGCTAMPASEHMARSIGGRAEPAGAQPAVVQGLQRQIRERDRRIAELSFQLEALKKIEQETESRRQQGRFPVSQDR